MKGHFLLPLQTIILFLCCLPFSCKSTNNDKQQHKSFKPGEIWFDTDGIHINAHGGGILADKQTYYWFGEFKTLGKKGNSAQVGVSCYSSNDLYNWKNEGIALKVSDQPGSDIEKGCIIERPKVIFNEKTGKYIMWFHLELKNNGYSSARTALAISDKPTGPYTFVKSLRPNKKQWPIGYATELATKDYPANLTWWTQEWYQAIGEGLFLQRDFKDGQMSRDMTLFVDDNGKAYHIHSSEDNLTLHISELTDDYLDFSGRYIRIFPGGHNEAPALFKKGNTYYLMASGCTGWDPNAARMYRATSIDGPWESLGNPCVGDGADKTFNSQSTYILPVCGKKDAFIYMGDRWQPNNPINGRYIWLPVVFEEGKPVIKWKEEWELSVF